MTRSMVLGALEVCSVPKTRCPVSAAVSASEMVSRSRISPIRITSGSSRSALRRALVNDPVCGPTSRWLTRQRLGGCTNSIGSSTVRMCASQVWLMTSTIAARVVDLPTGSGKSTTLAAMVDVINQTWDAHILTVEDPIEFVHQPKRCLVNQREVGPHTGSFTNALRSALREDPDVILIGEMRDLETISLALTAPETIDRIIDVFPAGQQAQIRTMLSESLEAVVAQTLVKKKGGGRVAACEILVGVPAVRNLIREAKLHQIPSMMQTGQRVGMQTLDMALADLVKRGVIEPTALPPRPA